MRIIKTMRDLVRHTVECVVQRNQYRVMVMPWCNLYQPQIKRILWPFWWPLHSGDVGMGCYGAFSYDSSEEAWGEIEKHKHPPEEQRAHYEYSPLNPSFQGGGTL